MSVATLVGVVLPACHRMRTRTRAHTDGSLLTYAARSPAARFSPATGTYIGGHGPSIDVATSTVHRAFAALKNTGLIEVTRGNRAVVSRGYPDESTYIEMAEPGAAS